MPGLVTPEAFDADDVVETAIADPTSIIHIDSRAAAQWLGMIQAAPKGAIAWRQDVVEAYSAWTARMNGHGLPADIEIDRDPHDWNLHYFALFAERLLDEPDPAFDTDMALVTGLPDEPFGEVAQTIMHAADALYFNDPRRAAPRPAAVRDRLIARVTTLNRWEHAGDPASARIDMESGGIIAKMLLNTHDPFNGTHSYLPIVLFDRVDPMLDVMRPLLPGGPTTFVALCTMNLLLVAPRARHIEFLLEATEAWFGRTQGAGLWISAGIGRKVVQWFEAATTDESALLAPAHPSRVRIDRVLGQLVGVGVAEAHDLELRVEAATGAAMAHQTIGQIVKD